MTKPNQKYICFDFETCNLNLLEGNLAWNLAFIIAEGDEIKEEHDYYPYWPNLKISDDAARICRFNKGDYKSKGCKPDLALDHFEKYLYDDDYIVVGHNILGFDIYVHNQYRKELGLKPNFSYVDRCIDTNCLAKTYKLNLKYNPEIEVFSDWMWRSTEYHRKGLKTSLQAMGKELNFKFDENKMHAGLEDIRLNWKVFKQLKFLLEL